MSLFAWSSAYSIGVPRIDAEHQKLFSLAGQLHEAMLAGSAREVLQSTLANLIAYTRAHFAHEEEIMLRSRYPEYSAHKTKHDELTSKVLDFQREFAAGKVSVSIEMLGFLKNWLAHHIAGTDQLVGSYLKKTA